MKKVPEGAVKNPINWLIGSEDSVCEYVESSDLYQTSVARCTALLEATLSAVSTRKCLQLSDVLGNVDAGIYQGRSPSFYFLNYPS